MKFNRRNFLKSASGALAYASAPSLLASAGLANEKPIVLGNILDQTGGLNIYSLQQIKSTALAVDELNAAGGVLGRPLQLSFYDSQSNNQLNAQYMTEALVRDEAVVVHGGVTSSSREVMRPIVKKFGGLYFYNSMYEGGVCDPRLVCPAMVPSQQLKPLVPHVVKNMGKRAYILGADYLYPHTMADWIKQYTQDAGGEVIATEFFPLDVSNFASAISRIQAEKPDVVWSVLVGSAHNAFYRQYEATVGKDNIPLASCMFGIGREQTYMSSEESAGIVNATSFHDGLDTDAARSFLQKFQDFTGEQSYVGDYGELGYRGIHLWALAAQKAGDSSADAVIEALPGISFNSPGGPVTIDSATNHAIMDIHLVEANHNQGWDHLGTFEQLSPVDPNATCNLTG
ncbi:transporter substrate-binding protein [Celeribacter halophilus]|uniref:transporter substrate-binding protein n=1 Tax=Celeribacter halophilus TaxID=576117 RepID=UPI003A8CA8D6